MSQHPPQHPTDPHPASPGTAPTPGFDPTPVASRDTDPTDTRLADADLGHADVVAGDPPVPLTVWRTARTGADSGRIGVRLAARLVAAYSRPGEAVVDLTDGHALADACTAGGRRHHPARFTEAAELLIGPTTAPTPGQDDASGDTDEQDPVPEVGGWFGDDLTDPDLPPAAGPVTDVPDAGSHAAASLAVASWPLHASAADTGIGLERLLAACSRLLGPGGCLILLIASPPTRVVAPQDFSDVVAAAAEVGLGYLQHIVAVLADTSTDGDAFVYHLREQELLTLATTDPHQRQAVHLRAHADLLVFAHPEPHTTSRRSGRGGGRRG